jgi:putative membrane protein
MPYDTLNGEKPIIRDYLAAERTHLANERTLLAYLRSAIMLLITAITIIKLFEGDIVMETVSFVLGPLSLLVGAFGVYRFQKTRKKLTAYEIPGFADPLAKK